MDDAVDASTLDAVIVSSDSVEEKLWARAKQCFPKTPIVRLYEGLPPGPYDKQGDLPAGIDTIPGPAETINLDSVVALASSVETKRRIADLFNRMTADPYARRLSDGYTRGVARFGESWRYVDLWSMWYAYAGTGNPGPTFVTDEMKRLGFDVRIEFLSGSSHEVLPPFLRGANRSFDLITVDGDHSRDGARADLLDVVDHLRLGGMLAFDDINHPQHAYLYGSHQLAALCR